MNDKQTSWSKKLERVREGKFDISIEKAWLITESFKESEGNPQVIRCAQAFRKVLENIDLYIERDDLYAGTLASQPGALELSCLWSVWGGQELDNLCESGFRVKAEDRPRIWEMNSYWQHRSLTSRMTQLYDDERLWPYAQLGVVLPAFRSREEGWGPGGMIGCGWGVHHEISQIIGVYDYEAVLQKGLYGILEEVREKLSQTSIASAEDVQRIDLLKAMVIVLEAVIAYAKRLARLADNDSQQESDQQRRQELERIRDLCEQVPANPARTFEEAVQALWLMYTVILPSGVLSLGRLDQLLFPYYQKDTAAGQLTDQRVLEILQWLRIKDSQIVITAGQTHRNKYGGLAKWHNLVIGGQNEAGEDVTNPLTFLVLEAARTMPTPHPTITLRVHAGTPDALMHKALELIGTGVGLPALLGDESCIDYLTREGVKLEKARGYAVAGCLGVNIIGESRSVTWPMFVTPLVFLFAMHDGVDLRSGKQVGPATGKFADFKNYDEFLNAVKIQLRHFMQLQAEFNNVTQSAYGERYPQALESALTKNGIGADKNLLGRTMPLENGSVLNPIGMINVADSLAAVKYCVYDSQSVTADELLAQMTSDWQGEAGKRVRDLLLAAPKYGNDDDYVDDIAADLYAFWATEVRKFTTAYGGTHKPGSITIGTCVWPGGAQTGATPDGRGAGEPLAEESLTPMREREKNGPLAALRSALKIDQGDWQALALDMRLAPALTANEDGRKKVIGMIRDYFAGGGKHVQFNCVSQETLLEARQNPEKHLNLIVRIGGCSAYFTQLAPAVQDEIISRAEITDIY